MGAFFAAMRAEIEAEGGTVEKFIGDAIMAAFGVPSVHEDDPARALRAALRMRAPARASSTRSSTSATASRSSCGSGSTPARSWRSPTRGPARRSRRATPSTRRRASSRPHEPGQVLVSERTAQAAPHFRFGSAHALELRGQGGAAARRRAGRPSSRSPRARSSGSRAPLVGRRRELELLGATYRRAIEERRPHLVTLYGEAGVGKSRLVGRVARRPRGGGAGAARRCAAAASPTATGSATGRSRRCSRRYAQSLDTDPAEVARARVLDAAAGRARGSRRRCARRARGHPRPRASAWLRSITPSAAPQELRAETQLAWRAFFSALAADAPTVVLVEDVQWADAAVLELLEDVAAHAAGPLVRAVHGAARADGAAADLGRRTAELHRARRRAARRRRERPPRGAAARMPASAGTNARRSSRGPRAIRSSSRRSPARAPASAPAAERAPRHRPRRARGAHRPAAGGREARAADRGGRRPRVLARRGRRGRGARRRHGRASCSTGCRTATSCSAASRRR